MQCVKLQKYDIFVLLFWTYFLKLKFVCYLEAVWQSLWAQTLFALSKFVYWPSTVGDSIAALYQWET